MSVTVVAPRVIFPDYYDARCEFETPSKGFLGDVIVQLEDGTRYKVFFYDPARLSQTLEDDAQAGRPYFSEPNLVILPEVTTESIKAAVQGLWKDGYFKHLKPL